MESVDLSAVALGVVAQWAHVGALYLFQPLEGALAGSLGLVLATGLVGGVVAGDRAGPPPRHSGRHGVLAGLVGGAGTGTLFWALAATPGAPRGAFWSLAYLVATNPPPGAREHGVAVLGLLAGGLAAAIATLAWLAGRRAPGRPDSLLSDG